MVVPETKTWQAIKYSVRGAFNARAYTLKNFPQGYASKPMIRKGGKGGF